MASFNHWRDRLDTIYHYTDVFQRGMNVIAQAKNVCALEEVNQEGSHDLLQHFEVEESAPTEL